ncbi:putative NBD/HSP70 family sugar kinase [Sphingomonas sp. BE270]|jgi:predicted NBD/HSP70 family sugar kinase|uniref:ROK family transcriptional regulator n=1 Tax=Sphingomonas sp. BE270 TaxID=2817726 RepID=UPI0028668CD8|nr:ROK family transcriptional regulator [Sphingomonas sp. BE270]MDR7259941.1 putative NBD/HSP70 family sugar kinase [Sphingomonas sp. BE270]
MIGDGRDAKLSRSLSGTNLARAGDYNLRTVLQAIRLTPDTTRVAIARQTGLTAPTIANITTRLAEMGLVRINGRKQGGRGQPALQLRVEPDGAFAIGLNIDRDHLSLVTLDLAGAVRSRVTRPVAFALPEDVAQFIREELDSALATGGVDRNRVLGVGVAVPDELGSISLPGLPPSYGIWAQTDLATLLSPLMPWPIHCDNDAATAALGEAEYGTAFENPTFFYLLISAGLGGGVVIDRSYHRGATARSGEIGLMPDPSAGIADAKVQDTVSVSALLDRLAAQGVTVTDVTRLDPLEGPADAIVAQWLTDAVRSLVGPLTAINCLLDPDAILIGGRLPMPLILRLAAGLTEALGAIDLPVRAKIIPAVMAQDAPAIGAAILPFLDHLLPSDSILIQAGR